MYRMLVFIASLVVLVPLYRFRAKQCIEWLWATLAAVCALVVTVEMNAHFKGRVVYGMVFWLLHLPLSVAFCLLLALMLICYEDEPSYRMQDLTKWATRCYLAAMPFGWWLLLQ